MISCCCNDTVAWTLYTRRETEREIINKETIFLRLIASRILINRSTFWFERYYSTNATPFAELRIHNVHVTGLIVVDRTFRQRAIHTSKKKRKIKYTKAMLRTTCSMINEGRQPPFHLVASFQILGNINKKHIISMDRRGNSVSRGL